MLLFGTLKPNECGVIDGQSTSQNGSNKLPKMEVTLTINISVTIWIDVAKQMWHEGTKYA